MRTRRARSVVSGLAALVVLAGCGGSLSPDGPAASPTPSSAPPTVLPTESRWTAEVPSATATTATPTRSPTTPAPSGTTAPTSPPATSPTPAACTVPPALEGQDVERIPTARRIVALTFDGGSGAQGAPAILDTLARYDVPATFFLTGGFARTFPAISARIADEHLVGNHTDTHPDLTTLGDDEVAGEIRTAEQVLRRTTGEDPRRFFRFPFGARDERTIDLVNDLCYVPFRWTVDTLGWKGTSGGQTTTTVVRRVLDGATAGGIVLMHLGANPDDGTTLDADALPRVITGLRDAGYGLVALDRVLDPAP